MLTIRLSRIGKKKQPSFRLLISEKHKDPWGDYLELLGNYNPRTKELNLKTERIKYWLQKGAQMSNTVNNLLITAGVIEGKKKKAVFISRARKEKIQGKKSEQEKQTATKIDKQENSVEKIETETTSEKTEEPTKEEATALAWHASVRPFGGLRRAGSGNIHLFIK